VLWRFVQRLYHEKEVPDIEHAVRRILKIPSLPPQLPPDVLEGIPEGPGVYLFYGANPLPLYIGKSRHLRERIASHFSSDWRSETDQRLSAEIRRIEVEPTAGELGALLREATLVKALMPAHNRALRRKSEAGMLRIDEDGTPTFVPATALAAGDAVGGYGPFGSKRAMREALMALAHEHALCWRRLGLERRVDGPCFGRQVRKCAGACDGGESAQAHDARLREALAPHALPAWPWPGPAVVREAAADGTRCDVHVLRDWSWLGTARDDSELEELLDAPPRAQFDGDVTRLLLRLWTKQPGAFLPVR
jgi:DNA polymerase-3 subunit epsilon